MLLIAPQLYYKLPAVPVLPHVPFDPRPDLLAAPRPLHLAPVHWPRFPDALPTARDPPHLPVPTSRLHLRPRLPALGACDPRGKPRARNMPGVHHKALDPPGYAAAHYLHSGG